MGYGSYLFEVGPHEALVAGMENGDAFGIDERAEHLAHGTCTFQRFYIVMADGPQLYVGGVGCQFAKADEGHIHLKRPRVDRLEQRLRLEKTAGLWGGGEHGGGDVERLLGLYPSGDGLSFSQGGTSLMACPEGVAQAAVYMGALRMTRAYRLQGNTLELMADGKTLATFEAASPR